MATTEPLEAIVGPLTKDQLDRMKVSLKDMAGEALREELPSVLDALYERIGEVIARTARHNHGLANTEKFACLFLDIDRFKVINDTYGHDCGDAVLQEFSARIKDCIRQSDMASRLAGDEFVILLEGLDQPDDAASVAKKILAAMTVPFITEYGNLSVTTSIGIAVSSDIHATSDSLLKDADEALYEAKKKGRNTFAIKTDLTMSL